MKSERKKKEDILILESLAKSQSIPRETLKLLLKHFEKCKSKSSDLDARRKG